MDAGSIETLELKSGEPVTAAHIAQLDRKITQNAGLRSVGVRRRQYPWGTHYSYFGRSGLASAPVFQPAVQFDGQGIASITWLGPRALIGGIAPTLGGIPGVAAAKAPEIFTPDDKGDLPALLVTKDSFDPSTLECRIYFAVTVYPLTFFPQTVTPMAFPGAPPPKPFTAYKLALFLRMRNGTPSYDEAADRELFCSQGFMAVNQKPDGTFTPLFWALF